MDDIDDRADYLESIGLYLGWNRGKVKCQVCHSHWHSWEYETCYDCRPSWLRYDRREFTQDQRIDIFERDDYKCVSCGERDEYLQVDHIMPCVRGGEADLWNGQVLCAKCNQRKAADWNDTEWPERRNMLIHFYLTFGWGWLTYGEQELLVAEARSEREIRGYRSFSGWFETSKLESESLTRTIILNKTTPRVHYSGGRLHLVGEQGPVPAYVNVVDGETETRRPLRHGDRFLWHAHVIPYSGAPQWAVDEADTHKPDDGKPVFPRYGFPDIS